MDKLNAKEGYVYMLSAEKELNDWRFKYPDSEYWTKMTNELLWDIAKFDGEHDGEIVT